MFQIDNKLVSEEIFTERFICDLTACKGACCVEGDYGAPLEQEEISNIQENLMKIKPFMTPEGIEKIEKEGVYYLDPEKMPVTTLNKNKECSFSFKEQDGTTKCSIEKSYREGKINFNKPISCHLYPIRIKKFNNMEAINFDEWSICNAAKICGAKHNVKVFEFLKEPLIRKYGESFYNDLKIIEKEFSSENI